MTVLPLSREHPVWPSCLYHGYTVYSPVHEAIKHVHMQKRGCPIDIKSEQSYKHRT